MIKTFIQENTFINTDEEKKVIKRFSSSEKDLLIQRNENLINYIYNFSSRKGLISLNQLEELILHDKVLFKNKRNQIKIYTKYTLEQELKLLEEYNLILKNYIPYSKFKFIILNTYTLQYLKNSKSITLNSINSNRVYTNNIMLLDYFIRRCNSIKTEYKYIDRYYKLKSTVFLNQSKSEEYDFCKYILNDEQKFYKLKSYIRSMINRQIHIFNIVEKENERKIFITKMFLNQQGFSNFTNFTNRLLEDLIFLNDLFFIYSTSNLKTRIVINLLVQSENEYNKILNILNSKDFENNFSKTKIEKNVYNFTLYNLDYIYKYINR